MRLKADKSKSNNLKFKTTQQKVLRLLVYLLEAKGPVSMISLEKLYRSDEELEKDKRRTIYRHLDILENKWGIELIRGDHYSIRKKSAFQPTQLNSTEAQALYFSAQDISDPDLRMVAQGKLLQIYQERKRKEDLIPTQTLDLMDWCEQHINRAKQKMQMRILGYTSINSRTEKDRLVVPVAFNRENVEFYAYDLEDSGVLKVFKLDRMCGMEKLKEKAPKYLNLDGLVFDRDPFGYLTAGKILLRLDLRMDLKAFVLFTLHFANLVSQVEKIEGVGIDKPYRIELEVLRVDPLAGWLMGLVNHIDIEESLEFKKELRHYIGKYVTSQLNTLLES
jgi:predicted DNA-binding transcriptional regulator YafY